jgi:hypothetical protein
MSTREPFARMTELAPRGLPELHELAVTGTSDARDFDYLITVLANTGWLVRLDDLTLARGDLSAFGAGQLAAALGGRRLTRLDLTGTRVRRSLLSQLERTTDQLVTTEVVHELGPAPEPVEAVEHAQHPEWGRGRVVRRFDGKIEVEFPEIGRRVFRADAAALRFP